MIKKVFLICLISTLTYSQQRVQGSVKDIYSEKGLEGVTVVLLTRDDLATEQVTSIDNDGLAEYTIAANYDNPYQQYQYYLQGKYRFSEQ